MADEVQTVNRDLVARDRDGRPFTVRYDAVNAMLLNEFLKEHRKNEEQEATIGELRKEMRATVARLKEQELRLQRVSDRLELNQPVRRLAVSAR